MKHADNKNLKQLFELVFSASQLLNTKKRLLLATDAFVFLQNIRTPLCKSFVGRVRPSQA
jgi:hypothetical protein